jgi:HEAT repeat protein
MKALSPRASQLVDELVDALRQAPGFLGRLAGRDRAVISTLAEFASHPEPAVVPYLLPFLVGNSKPLVTAAVDVLSRAIDAASPEDLLDLDAACRRVWAYGPAWDEGWHALRPLDVARFRALGTTEPAVVGVASFHGNGRVREAAVTRLDALSNGRELPFLLIRLNDWVTPVAERAAVAVARRIVPEYAQRFLDSIPIVERLGLSLRRDHGALVEHVYALLRQPEQRDIVLRGLESPDRRTRRLCFRLGLNGTDAERLDVLRHALADTDTVLRTEAAAEARRTLGPGEAARLLPMLLADPYAPVRREALALAAERLPAEATESLYAALLDQNPVVREVARFYLRRRGERADFAGVYRDHLSRDAGPKRLAAALAGLGETGTVSDVASVRAYCTHPRPSVRRAAVRALGMLDGEGQLPVLVQSLRDPAGSVARAARDQLRRRASLVAADVHEVFRSSAYPHTRLYALTLLSALGKWDSLPYLFEAAADADARIRAIARERLDAWIARQNRTMVQPTPRQLASSGRASRHTNWLSTGGSPMRCGRSCGSGAPERGRYRHPSRLAATRRRVRAAVQPRRDRTRDESRRR